MDVEGEFSWQGVAVRVRFKWKYPHTLKPCIRSIENTAMIKKELVAVHAGKNGEIDIKPLK